jgi:hypothetical protein
MLITPPGCDMQGGVCWVEMSSIQDKCMYTRCVLVPAVHATSIRMTYRGVQYKEGVCTRKGSRPCLTLGLLFQAYRQWVVARTEHVT